jgi:hypothetical protein
LDYFDDSERQAKQKDHHKAWMKARRDAVLGRVTAYEVLRRFGVDLRQGGDGAEEQFSCPFHGKDEKPSARVYPQNNKGYSSCYCFVCRKQWNAIDLWHNFSGGEPGKGFGGTLAQMERAYGLKPPERPEVVAVTEDTRQLDEAKALLDVCERRLLAAKPVCPMQVYLVLGTVLDRLWARLEAGKVTYTAVQATAAKVLARVGTYERAG